MIDLLFLSHNRLAFTRASLENLLATTDWSLVNRVLLYDDDSVDGTREYVESMACRFPCAEVRAGKFGTPVAVMNHYLSELAPSDATLFAKIDSDVIVPSGWLNACVQVMHDWPELSLLGIEAFNPVESGNVKRSYRGAEHIGGIGLFRNQSFITLPRPNGYYGFTAWQSKSPWVRTGWIDPALPVFLLDRLPMDPWRSLSREYVAKGWQRDWGAYSEPEYATWGTREPWAWWSEVARAA